MIAAADAPARDTLDHIAIAPEFRRRLPPLSEEEYEGLKANVITDGLFTDPFICWCEPGSDGTAILLDGHNRLSIWQEIVEEGKYPWVQPPRIEYVTTIHNRTEALRWILEHQLRRRNVTPEEKSLLRAQLTKTIQKQGAHNPSGNNQHTAPHGLAGAEAEVRVQNEPEAPGRAVEVVAAQQGVSPSTVKRDLQLDKALESIRAVDEQFVADYLARRIKPRPSRDDIVYMGECRPPRIANGIENIRQGRKWNYAPAPPEPTQHQRDQMARNDVKELESRVQKVSRGLARVVEAMGGGNDRSEAFGQLLTEMIKQAEDWRQASQTSLAAVQKRPAGRAVR